MRRTTPLAAAGLLLAGCAGTTVGTGSPSPSSSPSPADAGFEEVLGDVDLSQAVGQLLVGADVAVDADGRAVALLTDGQSGPSYVVELPAGAVHEIPFVFATDQVFLTPDGDVLVSGTTEEPDDATGFQVIALRSGAAEADVRPLDPQLDYYPRTSPTALSADGRTMLAGFSWSVLTAGSPLPTELVALDVATGTVLAREQLTGDLAAANVVDLAIRPDGGVSVLLQSDPNSDGRFDDGLPLHAQFDENLRLVGEPVELSDFWPEPVAAQEVTADGATVVAVRTGTNDLRVVTVVDGEASSVELELRGLRDVRDIALSPDGRSLYLPYEDDTAQWALGTLDLESGRLVGSLALCERPEFALDPVITLSADGTTATVLATCVENGEVHAFTVG
jgi:hypothetical protein